MEDSGKGKRDGKKELSTPSPHVDDEKDKKTIVYKTKEGGRKGDQKKKNYSKIIALGHVRGYSLQKLHL